MYLQTVLHINIYFLICLSYRDERFRLSGFGDNIGGNVLVLSAVADLEAQTCQPALLPNRSTALELTTSPAIESNACWQ
jgi:hypothetical protein